VYQGYGRIKLDEVLNFGQSSADGITLQVIGDVDSSSPYYREIQTVGDVHTFTITTSGESHPIRITMAYTDYPGATGSTIVTVNDLALSAGNETHTFETLMPSQNDKNVVEMIIIENPTINSTYTVNVSADSLTIPQPYALVITGRVQEMTFNSTDGNNNNSNASLTAIPASLQAVIAVTSLLIVVLGIILVSIYCSAKSKKKNTQERDTYQAQVRYG